MGVTAVIAGAAALGAGTQLYTAKRTNDRARDAREDLREETAAQEQSLRTEKEKQDQSSAQAQARARQKAIATGGVRQDTLLTGPLGLLDNAPIATKTLLGY